MATPPRLLLLPPLPLPLAPFLWLLPFLRLPPHLPPLPLAPHLPQVPPLPLLRLAPHGCDNQPPVHDPN
ncbi:MAG TPA: hypothetical protein VKU39_16940 [Streptosporangiaceae bacterium]|nr:hypothetical protein [Streptosporangiaceae bacterium]